MKNFITFEGGEGTGKSTQAKLLYKAIHKISKNAILTREPGGTVQSETLRNLVVKKKFRWDSLTELLLFNAARHEHIKNLIIPELKKKKIIICDRYIDSTYVYQVKVQNVQKKYFSILNKIIVKNILPQVTFLIDLDPQIGIKRSLKRKKNTDIKFETYDLNFHKKIRKSFLRLSKSEKRIIVINGNKKIRDIHVEIVDKFNDLNIFEKKISYSL